MGFLDSLANLNPPYQSRGGQAYASVFPAWEQTTPQYPAPNAYTLAVNGYRRNELTYACVHKWEVAISQAPLRAYKDAIVKSVSGKDRVAPEELKQHGARQLIRNPNPAFGEKMFWRTTETYLNIAGFAAWEIELNNFDEPLRLWPMRPDWCSFMRGPQKLLRTIRYQPYGLPFADVPIERVLLFSYFDPIFPLLKALSPSAVAMRTTEVDNAVTDFLKLFFDHGAVINGLLVTDQTIQEAEANRIRERWRQQHGGIGNWTDVAVLGQGVKYQETGKDFRSMQFSEIDEREEQRICQCFHIDPILVGGRVAAGSSTYNNKSEAHKGWHREEVVPMWDWLADEAERQLSLYWPDLQSDEVGLRFDLSKIYALAEDRSQLIKDITEAAKAGLYYRDLALEKLGDDPVDDGEKVWLNVTIREQGIANQAGGEVETTAQPTNQLQPGMQPKALPAPKPTAAEEAAQAAEKKQFRVFAQKRIREGHPEKVGTFEFHYLSDAERKALIMEALPDSQTTPDKSALMLQFSEAMQEFREAMTT